MGGPRFNLGTKKMDLLTFTNHYLIEKNRQESENYLIIMKISVLIFFINEFYDSSVILSKNRRFFSLNFTIHPVWGAI